MSKVVKNNWKIFAPWRAGLTKMWFWTLLLGTNFANIWQNMWNQIFILKSGQSSRGKIIDFWSTMGNKWIFTLKKFKNVYWQGKQHCDCGTDILNCGRISFVQQLIFLLPDRIWSPSADFRRPKHGQNCPAANFRPKDVCSSMYTGLFTNMSHHIFLFVSE